MIIDKLIFRKHLEKGEEILYTVHKHWIDILKPTLEVAFFGFVLPWSLFFIGFNTPLFFRLVLFWSLLAYLRFIHILMGWYSNAWVVTNLCVIAVEWNGLFSNVSTRCGYEDVEGAAYQIKGFWATILGYGNITLRVMSQNNFDLNNVANPKKTELELMRFKNKVMHERNLEDTNHLKNLLSDMVAHHNRQTK